MYDERLDGVEGLDLGTLDFDSSSRRSLGQAPARSTTRSLGPSSCQSSTEPPASARNPLQLQARINAAFAAVDAGSEASINAQHAALDADVDADADAESAPARTEDADAGRHWSDYGADELEDLVTVLPSLSVGSWRFHIPAFLLAALDRLSRPVWETGLPGAVLFNLTYAADDRAWSRRLLDRFQALDAAQTAAVCAFLEFVSENPNQEPLRALDADRALRRYWRLQESVRPTVVISPLEVPVSPADGR